MKFEIEPFKLGAIIAIISLGVWCNKLNEEVNELKYSVLKDEVFYKELNKQKELNERFAKAINEKKDKGTLF